MRRRRRRRTVRCAATAAVRLTAAGEPRRSRAARRPPPFTDLRRAQNRYLSPSPTRYTFRNAPFAPVTSDFCAFSVLSCNAAGELRRPFAADAQPARRRNAITPARSSSRHMFAQMLRAAVEPPRFAYGAVA